MSLSDSHSASSSCRILTVSASLEHALSFIHRIRDHSQPAGAPSISEVTREPAASDELVKVPWTITNKYYSADVHFAAHTVDGLTPDLVRDVPAVVFVWVKGEPYRAHVERLSQDMEECEPEVSLAVRVHTDSPSTPGAGEEEEEGDIDEFLSSHGFEYVCVSDETESQVSDGVPNFPRVIDALSTIMWPSMQAKSISIGDASIRKESEDSEDETDPWSWASSVWESPTVMGFEDDFTGSYEFLKSELGSDDEDMPSREEVAETRGRIFGGGEVLARLEEMKLEIAEMESEEERRKAAARVALGVVYGL